mgnify:CR=1 FL=1
MELSFRDKILLQGGKVFLRLTSRNIFGDATYAYLVSDREMLDKLKKEIEQKAYVSYSDYGDMIMFGAGEPDAQKEEMAIAIAMKKYS